MNWEDKLAAIAIAWHIDAQAVEYLKELFREVEEDAHYHGWLDAE